MIVMGNLEIQILANLLIAVHFSIPLAYYWYFKRKWFGRPWDLKLENDCTPSVTVLVPTYNEAKLIKRRLENICVQKYPKELLEILVVDSGSADGTLQAVAEWEKNHQEVKLRMLGEPVRKGKMHAITESLKHVSTSLVVVGDADSLWDVSAIRNTVKYFADPSVGAVTSSLRYSEGSGWEDTYRQFYNVLRVAESKRHSTPMHSGVLQAIRMEFVDKFGLPSYPGSEDCAVASYVAFSGYRAIQVDDVWAFEPMRGSYLRTKVRRAQHNLLNFILTKRYVKSKGQYVRSRFELIWHAEMYLYLVNPWLFAVPLVVTAYFAIALWNVPQAVILGLGGILFVKSKAFRSWATQQVFLTIGLARILYTRDVVW